MILQKVFQSAVDLLDLLFLSYTLAIRRIRDQDAVLSLRMELCSISTPKMDTVLYAGLLCILLCSSHSFRIDIHSRDIQFLIVAYRLKGSTFFLFPEIFIDELPVLTRKRPVQPRCDIASDESSLDRNGP